MAYAWIENNAVRDIAPGDPATLYHPDVAAYYSTEIPDDISRGATLIDGVWVNPTPPAPQPSNPQTIYPVYGPIEFKLRFTVQERLEIKAARSTDVVVDDFYSLLDDPRLTAVDMNLQSVRDAIVYLESQGYLGAGRANIIIGAT